MTKCIFFLQDGSGRITGEELRQVCQQFNLPAEPELIEQVMDYCDQDKDGQINYQEFANFLNWKDKLPSGLPQSGESRTNYQELHPIAIVKVKYLIFR